MLDKNVPLTINNVEKDAWNALKYVTTSAETYTLLRYRTFSIGKHVNSVSDMINSIGALFTRSVNSL